MDELVFYVPTQLGFKKLCYVSYQRLREIMLDKGHEAYIDGLFLDCWCLVIEDHRGDMHLASHPIHVYNLDVVKALLDEAERLKKEEPITEDKEIPF